MFWKLVIGSMLLAEIVDCGRDPCKKTSKKMDKCLKSGYKFRDCAVGQGEMTAKLTKKCEKMANKIAKKCPHYECETGSFGEWRPIFNETSPRFDLGSNLQFKVRFTPHKAVDKGLYLSTVVYLYNDVGKEVGLTNVIFRPKPGSLSIDKRFYHRGWPNCWADDEYLDDLADMDFIFTTAVDAGADMYQFETSSGRMIIADMSECEYLPKWEEMVKTEAVSAEINLRVSSRGDELNDYFTTEYMVVQG